MNLGRLRAMMPPPSTACEPIDWPAAEAVQGPFPADYRAFIDAYGVGGIGDHLDIGHPLVVSGPGEPPIDVEEYTGDARFTFARVRTGLPDEVTDPVLLRGWGGSDAADTLCWLATDPDPDRWPVVVWKRGLGRWLLQDLGMVDFLVALLTAELDSCPLSDRSLWGNPNQEYFPWQGQ
ncbi:hypothetical protein [Kitasatospora sp. NPDC088134]|uniref:hypothetical protein n=1 Tax=Kitasatospora sp. NPDC088134 TaxID=3364071 RepID=UPI003829DC2F